MYLIDSSSESVGKVLQSGKEGVDKTAKLTVNYYTATRDDAYSYVKVIILITFYTFESNIWEKKSHNWVTSNHNYNFKGSKTPQTIR